MLRIIKYFALSLLILLLAACKKYPENTLWFKNPKNIHPIDGFITKYEVDGVDSMDLLGTYYGTSQGLPKDIRESFFKTRLDRGDRGYETVFIHGNSGVSSSVDVQFSKNKKKIFLWIAATPSDYKKNFFFGKEWDILYLDKKGKLRIRTKENNKTYLMEIN